MSCPLTGTVAVLLIGVGWLPLRLSSSRPFTDYEGVRDLSLGVS